MKDKTFNFKKALLENLKIEKNRYNVKDEKTPGLRLVVYPSGVKTFVLLKFVNQKSQKIKIGRFPDVSIENARMQAQKLNSLIALGHDPHEDKIAERKEITFKDLSDLYYTQHALKHTKNPRHDRRMIELHVLPFFGLKKAKDINPEIVRKLHNKITEKSIKGRAQGKGSANRVMSAVSAIFNFGLREEHYKGINPCLGLKKYRSISRDRFLSFEELKSFFEALNAEKEIFQALFLTLLYTGARKSNVLKMKWEDIDFDLKRWRIGHTDTKNKDVNIVILSDAAINVLQSRKEYVGKANESSPYIFGGRKNGSHLKDPKKAFQRLRDRMNVQNIVMHDLRRTLASYMAIGGASLPIIGKALNHKSQVSTAIYARLSQDPVVEAVNNAVNAITQNRPTE